MSAYLVGIDEVGRGPLAGPVSVGVVLVPRDFDWALLPGVTDSKKLTPAKREAIYTRACALKVAGALAFVVASETAATIDTIGIVPSIKNCLRSALEEVRSLSLFGEINPRDIRVLLDGGLKAPPQYLDQETIIKGDAKESVIGLASIVAKVERDLELVRLASEYSGYGLEVHKGYGTKVHRAAIAALGLSAIHRRSFCRNIVLHNN